MLKHALSAVLLASALPTVAWAQLPLGNEFLVNTYTTSHQLGKAIASDASGNFVVVWQSYNQDSSNNWDVFGQRFDASGAPIGTAEFRVNLQTASHQRFAAVASDPTGRLVVVWESDLQDGSDTGVFGRRYSASGTPGAEFNVNLYTAGFQGRPSVAMAGNADFVVVWVSDGQDGDLGGVFGQRYSAAGIARGSPFQANAYATGDQGSPSVAMDAAGNFVVVWHSSSQDGDQEGIFGQRYDALGVPQGSEFQVPSYTTGRQTVPNVAMGADGDFVVVWTSDGQDGDGLGIFGQRYDASGLAKGSEFQLNSYTTGAQARGAVAMDPSGNFVVGWSSQMQDGAGYGAVARVFGASGMPQGDDFVVNSFTTSNQAYAVPAYVGAGRFVVAWTSYGNDGESYGMFARRFETDRIFEDGFE